MGRAAGFGLGFGLAGFVVAGFGDAALEAMFRALLTVVLFIKTLRATVLLSADVSDVGFVPPDGASSSFVTRGRLKEGIGFVSDSGAEINPLTAVSIL